MSLVTVQRSPDSASKGSSTNDDLILNKATTTSLYNPTSTTKTTTTTNRFSLNLSRTNNKFSNELQNEFSKQSASSLSSLSFTLTTSKTTNNNLMKKKPAIFNLDERPLNLSANVNDLKAFYSTDTNTSTSFNRSSINSNTIPAVNRKNSKNFKNSTLVNRHSLNILESSKKLSNTVADESLRTIKSSLSSRNLIEKYFVVKDAALILPKRTLKNIQTKNSTENLSFMRPESNSEEQQQQSNLNTSGTGDILVHLQSMISLLRPNDTIILAVKLFSYVQERIRYLVIVETQPQKIGDFSCEESAILGLDLTQINPSDSETDPSAINETQTEVSNTYFLCTVGLVLPIYANCEISLDGDGGFKFKSHQSTHIFKPVSIQAMWSAYQYLHKAFENARKSNFYSIQASGSCSSSSSSSNSPSFNSSNLNDFNSSNNNNNNNFVSIEQQQQIDANQNHDWVKYYSSLIGKNKLEQQSINEWYQKEERSAQREDFTTPYFDSLQLCKEQEEIGLKIKEKLKDIMINSKDDYGSMSSIYIREMLEKELQLKLDNFKRFIDATIFQFYNQLVECATRILPYLYLGTEWNASNYDSLINDGVTHILNISSEVDNFFPDTFKYLNIRVLDIDETDLLKEFDRTNKFIQEAKEQNSSCLVHCKMGVSRSASVVIAYLMKEYDYTYDQALSFAKQKRACVNPNNSFRQQLNTYESILNAHKAKKNIFEQSISSTSLLTTIQPNNNTNKVKSQTFIDQISSDSLLQPQLSPNSVKKQTSSTLSVSPNANQSPPFTARKFFSLSPTNIDPNFAPDTPKLVESEQQTFDFTHPNEPFLKHAQSCPNQMEFTKNKSFVRRLAKEIDTQSPSDCPQITNFYDPILESANISSINFTLSTENIEDSSQSTIENISLPYGTVKRQVESINIKSKPIEYPLIRQSTVDFDSFKPCDLEQKLVQQTTTSPDSKRFKCELLQLISHDLEKGDTCLASLEDEEVGVLSRLSEFNRSKKMFEQLGKDIEKEDKLKRNFRHQVDKLEEASSFKANNNIRQEKLNATVS